MKKLIPLINEIHDILNKSNLEHELKLPKVVVIGSQSTGKSSVLESIIGKEFLPRGKGIVTRRPIEIQLQNVKHEDGEKDHCVFFDQRDEKIYDFAEVQNKIQEETDKICGQNKGVSNNPVRLKIFSEDVVDLLLVDLPGMTKNPVGDQPDDIEKRIMDLLVPYVENPNSIILAVSRASDDLANSESLKLARSVDKEGIRTLGVITQLDLMDSGSDALNDLQGQTYPLRLGYTGVVMRGTKDMQKKTIKDQLVSEKLYFQNSETYRKIADKMGIPYLVKQLNLHFMNHIKACLPEIRENLVKSIYHKELQLKQYGDFEDFEDNKSKGLFVLNMVAKFSNAYKDLLEGRYLQAQHDQLIGGSRINFIFANIFRKSIDNIDPFEILTDEQIRTAIRNSNGIRPSLFVPDGAFENLVKQQISRLLTPSLQCSKLVYEELRRILSMISIPEIERFENLNSAIQDVMESVLQRILQPTDEMITNLIAIEQGFINTSHPDFCDTIDLVQTTSQQVLNKENEQLQQQTEREDKKNSGKNQNKNDQQNNKNNNNNNNNKQGKSSGDELDSNNESRQSTNNGRGDENSGFLAWMGFGVRQPNQSQKQQADIVDTKLKNMHFKKKHSQESQKGSYESQAYYQQMQQKGFQEEYQKNLVNLNQPKHNLPSVPSQIILDDSFTKKEQTETRMIKNLITSYFNVVKKKINDSIPKAIVTLLTSRSVSVCERELVSSLYQEGKFEELLQENDYIVSQRQEAKKELQLLNQCLNVLNDTESKC